MSELTLETLFGNWSKPPAPPVVQAPPVVVAQPVAAAPVVAPPVVTPEPAPSVPVALSQHPEMIQLMARQNELMARQTVALEQIAGFFLDIQRKHQQQEEADIKARALEAEQRNKEEAQAAALAEAEALRKDKAGSNVVSIGEHLATVLDGSTH